MREFNRREFLVGMTGTGLAVVLAACTPTQQPTQPSQPAGGLAKEQVIRIPLTEPPTLDPGLATDTVSLDVIVQIFDGLVGFDDAGNIFGIHAEKWDVSSDGITYTFYLRPGIKWSNGRPITAQDYEWAWKRNIDPKTASDYATTLFPIKNAQAIHEGKANPQTLGVRARDDRTLEVTLEAPAAYFLRLASTWTMFPLPREAIEKYGDKWTEAGNIVTNGAFKMSSWRHQQEIVLERNEDYWGKKPTLQRAVYRIFPEGAEEQVLAAYENDELDVARGIPPAQVDRILNDPKFKDQIKIFDQSGTMFIAVNNRRPHLRDPRVRKALGMTLERQVLIDRVLKVVAKPAYSLQPPELWAATRISGPRKTSRRPGGSWPTPAIRMARASRRSPLPTTHRRPGRRWANTSSSGGSRPWASRSNSRRWSGGCSSSGAGPPRLARLTTFTGAVGSRTMRTRITGTTSFGTQLRTRGCSTWAGRTPTTTGSSGRPGPSWTSRSGPSFTPRPKRSWPMSTRPSRSTITGPGTW